MAFRTMYLELHSFYYTEVHVGKNLEEQYEEYKGTKKKYIYIEVFTMKFVCFSLKVVIYFPKIQE